MESTNLRVCIVEYRAEGQEQSSKMPVMATTSTYLLTGLLEMTLYETRLYCLYGRALESPTEWIKVSTRTGKSNMWKLLTWNHRFY